MANRISDMGRIIAIDFGKKRCGIAVTDDACIIASPLKTVAPEDLVTFLKDFLSQHTVSTIVIGLPKRLNNQDTHVTKETQALKVKLEKIFLNVNIELHDERFTSKIALDSLIKTGGSKKLKKNKNILDETSAVVLLQSYMEANRM